METIIYKLVLEQCYKNYDCDGCSFLDSERVENYFPTKRDAVRIAQKMFARRRFNWCAVFRTVLTSKGVADKPKRIYNLFRDSGLNIYGNPK